MAAKRHTPIKHIFVDFENVHEIDIEEAGEGNFFVTLLVGPHKKKIDISLLARVFNRTKSVEVVTLANTGPNAVDFALAYYVGRAAVVSPAGSFHIVSKDKGFDPLVKHLQERNIKAFRHDDFSEIHGGARKADCSGTLEKGVTVALHHLRTCPKNRPGKKSTLVSLLKNRFGGKIDEAQLAKVVAKLEKGGFLTINEKQAITYHLD